MRSSSVDFTKEPGLPGLIAHLQRTSGSSSPTCSALLVGFAALSRHFRGEPRPGASAASAAGRLDRRLRALLCMVFVLSSFLDNIAAALIGGTVARGVFRGRVHVGYLAAIVGAAERRRLGSVVGDTTTTDDVDRRRAVRSTSSTPTSPRSLALIVLGIRRALQQQRHSPIVGDAARG